MRMRVPESAPQSPQRAQTGPIKPPPTTPGVAQQGLRGAPALRARSSIRPQLPDIAAPITGHPRHACIVLGPTRVPFWLYAGVRAAFKTAVTAQRDISSNREFTIPQSLPQAVSLLPKKANLLFLRKLLINTVWANSDTTQFQYFWKAEYVPVLLIAIIIFITAYGNS